MYYCPSPSPFPFDLTRRLATYFQIYPKNILEAVEEKKEKDFLETEFFVSLCGKEAALIR